MKELSLSFGHFKREDELPLTIIVNGCTYQSQSLVDATKKTYFEMGKQQGMELSADNTYSDKEMSRMHDAWYDAGYEARKRDQFNYDKLIDEANEKSRKTGYDDGFEEGKSAGYDAGYEEGFEIGKREANDKKPDSDNVIIGLHHVWFDEGYKKGYEAGKSESYGRGWIEGHNEASIKQFDEYSVKLEERYKSKYDAGYNDGFEEGKSEGFEEGKCAGYDEGYEAGKRDQFNDDNKLIDESNEKNTKLIDEGMKVARKLGYNEGFEEGKCAGYDEGFEIGKREANDKKPDYIPNEFDKGYSLGYQAAKLERKDTTYSDNVITRLNHALYDEGYKKG
jgi:flagellar biosynthesis/type III secretory pathway protein FliH